MMGLFALCMVCMMIMPFGAMAADYRFDGSSVTSMDNDASTTILQAGDTLSSSFTGGFVVYNTELPGETFSTEQNKPTEKTYLKISSGVVSEVENLFCYDNQRYQVPQITDPSNSYEVTFVESQFESRVSEHSPVYFIYLEPLFPMPGEGGAGGGEPEGSSSVPRTGDSANLLLWSGLLSLSLCGALLMRRRRTNS